MAAGMGGGGHATVVLLFPGWNWHSYTGAAPAALVAIDRQVYFRRSQQGIPVRGRGFARVARADGHSGRQLQN